MAALTRAEYQYQLLAGDYGKSEAAGAPTSAIQDALISIRTANNYLRRRLGYGKTPATVTVLAGTEEYAIPTNFGYCIKVFSAAAKYRMVEPEVYLENKLKDTPINVMSVFHNAAGTLKVHAYPQVAGDVTVLYIPDEPLSAGADEPGIPVGFENLLLYGSRVEFRDTPSMAQSASDKNVTRDKWYEMVERQAAIAGYGLEGDDTIGDDEAYFPSALGT